MDDRRFDALTRAFAVSSRRQLVSRAGTAAAAGVTALLSGLRTGLAGTRPPGTLCASNSDCASGICGPKDRTGRAYCQCASDADCPQPTNKCQRSICNVGACKTITVVTCTAPDQCHTATCSPSTGTCVYPNKTNGAACNDGNPCTVNDTCQNGVCTAGAAVQCEACNACNGGTCKPVANDARCTTLCCNGKCCAQGESCLSGQCQPACLPEQAACNPADNRCCNGRCEDVRTCGGEGSPQCCFGATTPCQHTCDCCDPYVCVGGICCGNFLNLPCDDEQRPCCNNGWQCLNGTCQLANCAPPGETCDPENPLCCEDEPFECRAASAACGGGNRCCRLVGGLCEDGCDCCGSLACSGGQCCKGEREQCSNTLECCAPMTCRGGLCLFDCPLGGYPCGATCCGSHEHCINGTQCDCIPLKGQCNSANNLCCQDEETLCPASNPYGNANTCCRPQGGGCTTAADCCYEVYDAKWGRDTCGDDGICGGAGAYCATNDDCVGARHCIGACFGKGIGFVTCYSNADCPDDVDGNATTCQQKRCIYPNEVPA